MESMYEVARMAIDQIPPACRVRPEDGEVISRHQDALLALGPDVVQVFYDTLYEHEATSKVFVEGERPMREQTLVDWWQRTVRGPLDDNYWAWMAMVGLIHVVRRVTNPMMLSMAEFVASFLAENIHRVPASDEERKAIVEAFNRVASMTSAVITWGFDHAVSSALFEVAGMPEALLARLRDTEIRDALVTARQEVQA